MIKKISDENELEAALQIKHDVYTEKIRALYRAYGLKYPFCSFYLQEDRTLTADYYGSAVTAYINAEKNQNKDKDPELSEFLSFNFGEILMPYDLYKITKPTGSAEKLFLMKYDCNENVTSLSEIDKEEYKMNISLGEAYEIIKDGFDIDFNKWYTDTSHNLRHNISEIYSTEKSACAVKMFSSNNISFYSYICTKKEKRSQGLASRLLEIIISTEKQNKNNIYLICTGTLKGFYERLGFSVSGYSASIIRQK